MAIAKQQVKAEPRKRTLPKIGVKSSFLTTSTAEISDQDFLFDGGNYTTFRRKRTALPFRVKNAQ